MIEIEDLKKVEVQPGDIFILQVDDGVSQAEVARLQVLWCTHVGEDVPLVILPRGDLSLYRHAPGDHDTEHATGG